MTQINNSRKITNKIVLGMMWFVIPLLILASILLFFDLLENKVSPIKQLVTAFGIILILIFAFILVISLTKYRKEILLNDNERKEKWKLLRKDFHNFWKKMIIFQMVLFIFMIISGVCLLFNPSSADKGSGILMIIIGIGLFTNVFIMKWREKNEKHNKTG